MSTRKKDLNGNTLPPQRTDEHRIDSEALKIVRAQITPDWEERSVEGRDYGIDMMVEAFDGNNPTGTLILLQIKGQQASFGGNAVSLSVPVRTLLYARMFQAPFFLVCASISDNRAYFVWIQKYINTRLMLDSPRWHKQEDVTIHFPIDNLLNQSGLKKIRSLASYVGHRDLGIAFLGHLILLRDHLDDFYTSKNRDSLSSAITRATEISKLQPFLTPYVESVPDAFVDFESLLQMLKKAKSYGDFDYGEDDLVESDITNLHAIARMFLSRDESDAFVTEITDKDLPY